MKNSKKILSLLLAMTMLFALAACGPKEPVVTPGSENTENVTPDVSTTPDVEPTLDPDITPEPEVTVEPSEEPTDEVNTPYSDELTITLFPDCEAQMTFPESWRGKYFVSTAEENHLAVSTYDETTDPYTQVQLAEFVKKSAVEETDIPENWATVLVERDDFCIVMYTNNDFAEMPEMAQMVSDLDTDSFFYIPEVKVIPEAAQPLVDAITNARSDEENQYNEIFCDPSDSMIYDFLGLTEDDTKNFAVSMSMMNVRAYAVMVVEAMEGKMDAVMTALQNYKDGQIQSYTNYLADQLEVAENAIIEKVGNYAVFVMCENADTVFESIKSALN